MKKINFFAMALAALTIVSCSKENAIDNGKPPVIEGVETYATFSFNIEGSGVKSRAVSETEGDAGVAADDEAVKDIRIAVFNNEGVLEATDLVTTTGKINTPIKLTSGVKKIFVFANSKNTAHFPALTVGTTTLADCYKSEMSMMEGDVFSIKNLVSDANGYFMSSTRGKNSTQTLLPNIPADVSQAGGAAANHFTFNVRRGVSKVKAQIKDVNVFKVGSDKVNPVAVLTGMKYTVRNLNKAVAPVQLFTNFDIDDKDDDVFEAGTPMAPYYDKFPANSADLKDQATFALYYDRSFKIDQDLEVKTNPDLRKSVFVTENTNANQVVGNTSYLAIMGTYTPTKVVSACTYNSMGEGSFTITEVANVLEGTFWKLNFAGVTGLQHIGGVVSPLTNTLFSGKNVVVRILDEVLAANGYNKNGTLTEQVAYSAAVSKCLLEYTNGETFYRLNIGKSSLDGLKTIFGIRRNSRYDITINSISKLGVNDEDKLDEEPETPVVSQETYVTATIAVKPWEDYTQEGDL